MEDFFKDNFFGTISANKKTGLRFFCWTIIEPYHDHLSLDFFTDWTEPSLKFTKFLKKNLSLKILLGRPCKLSGGIMDS